MYLFCDPLEVEKSIKINKGGAERGVYVCFPEDLRKRTSGQFPNWIRRWENFSFFFFFYFLKKVGGKGGGKVGSRIYAREPHRGIFM